MHKNSSPSCAVALLLSFCAFGQALAADQWKVNLTNGWNAVGFIEPPASEAFPDSVEWIVAFRDGKILVADLKGNQPPLSPEQLIPEAVREQFSETGQLDISTIDANEGVLVFTSEDCSIEVRIPDSVSMPGFAIGKWRLAAIPLGAYGSASAESDTADLPPNDVPFYSFLSVRAGKEPEVHYLDTTRAAVTTNDLTEAWEKAPTPGADATWRNEWRLRQGEAVWIKPNADLQPTSDLNIAAIEEVKIELDQRDQALPPELSNALTQTVIVSLGSSLRYADLKFSQELGASPCAFKLREVAWFKGGNDWYARQPDGHPTAETLLKMLRAASTEYDKPPGEELEPITESAQQPEIVISHGQAVLPYLETSHGPFSNSRAIRVNTVRMTKGTIKDSNKVNRILEPGFYFGRLQLISTSRNHESHPNIILTLEVPQLYGGYIGSIVAQVLGIRAENPEIPRTFFARKTGRAAGSNIPFSELLNATRPDAQSIELGKFPLSVRILPSGPDPVASFLQSGSFLVNADMQFSGKYDFFPLYNDFHAINVELDKAKKSLQLSHQSQAKVSQRLVPILDRPLASLDAPIPEGFITIRRDIKTLLQEDASGYLRGVYIERLGRSKSEESEGGLIRRAVKNPASGKATNHECEVYVIGEINLFRSTSRDQEELTVASEQTP